MPSMAPGSQPVSSRWGCVESQNSNYDETFVHPGVSHPAGGGVLKVKTQTTAFFPMIVSASNRP